MGRLRPKCRLEQDSQAYSVCAVAKATIGLEIDSGKGVASSVTSMIRVSLATGATPRVTSVNWFWKPSQDFLPGSTVGGSAIQDPRWLAAALPS